MYILNENLLNGTVTIDTYTTLVNTDSFDKAIQKIKDSYLNKTVNLVIIEENDDIFRYYHETSNNDDMYFKLFGVMRNEEARTI